MTQLFDKRNKLNDLSAKEWIQETKSFFFQKGLGASNSGAKYEKMHPAPFSYSDVMRLIRFFTKKDAKVLDPFLGVGSTIKACLELGREGFGVEISPFWCKLTKERLSTESEYKIDSKHLICGDSRLLDKYFDKETFDFIVTSPPYWSILEKKDHKANNRVKNGQATKYSSLKNDLGNINDYNVFLNELTTILFHCNSLLKPAKYMCVIVSDFRHGSEFIPFHANIVDKLTDINKKNHFTLKGITVILQNAKSLFPYGYPYSYVENIHHQYALIFQKQK